MANSGSSSKLRVFADIAQIIAAILGVIAIAIACISIYYAGQSLDKAKESLDKTESSLTITKDSFDLTKKSLQTATETLESTQESLEVARQALNLEILKSKPELTYEIRATIYPENDKKNDYFAKMEYKRGTIPLHEVQIFIEAGIIGKKDSNIIFNHPIGILQPNGELTYDNSNAYFIGRMKYNLDALGPNIFKRKKLNLLKLYATYCIKVGGEIIPYNDNELHLCAVINPDYE